MSKLEYISYLLNRYQKVELNKKGSAQPISLDNKTYTEQNLNETFKSWYDSLFHNESKIEELKIKIDKFNSKYKSYLKDIRIRLNEAMSNVRGANASDRSISEYATVVSYTPDNIAYDMNNTTAYVSGGKIIGVKEDDLINSSDISGIPINMNSVSVYSIINNKRIDAIWINSDGSIAKDVINARNRESKIEVAAALNSPLDIFIDIDRKEYGMFNTIQFCTSVAQVFSVYLSEDGIVYDRVAGRELTNELNVSFPNSNARYSRIVIHCDKPQENREGLYRYQIAVKSLYIAIKCYSSSTTYISGDIPINTIGEYISIDTCDNYQSDGVNISYSVSIDGGRFIPIRPLRKLSKQDRNTPTLIPLNGFLDNSVARLTEYTSINNMSVFSTELNSALLDTNVFQYFDFSNPIQVLGNYVTTTGINVKDVEIDYPDTYFINGVPYSGKAIIKTGINTVSFPNYGYTELFDISKASNIVTDKETVSFVDNKGSSLTVLDPTYKTNPFYIIVSVFKYILGSNLSHDEVSIIPSDNGYRIGVSSDIRALSVIARSTNSSISNARIRIDMSSIDGYSIPSVSRILIKVV